MIVKIDHIALSSSNLEQDIKTWRAFGYKLKFTERGVGNLKIKRSLMKKFRAEHDLAFLEKDGNFNIELVRHGHIILGKSFITPPVKNKKGVGFRFDEVIIRTVNIRNSSRFWKLLGFETIKKGKNYILLGFKSIFNKNQLKLKLVAGTNNRTEKTFLDSEGFNCLAFISTSIEDQRQLLKNEGYKTTKTEKIKLNNKQLKVFFANGPGGELVEIIGVIK